MIYDKKFLISELHRFYNENGRVPTMFDMQGKFGYPSNKSYQNYFGSYNKALETANLPLNQYHPKLDGTETCSYCGCIKIEGQNWYYDKNGNRFCMKHGVRNNPDYVKGELDINSNTGLGRAGEILVVKTLEIGSEHDCNRISCGYSFDMYHKDYGKIDVKTAKFDYKGNRWVFRFNAKKIVDTYICIGLSSDRKNVEHVWIVPNEDYIRDLTALTIKDTYYSLSTHRKWEIISKVWNNIWHSMKLDNCKIMVNKNN